MKHLKSYILFESISDNIVDTINDILLDINDLRNWKAELEFRNETYTVFIKTKDRLYKNPEYNSDLTDDYWVELDGNGLHLNEEIMMCIENLIEFMKSEGFKNYELTFEPDGDEYYYHRDLISIRKEEFFTDDLLRIFFKKYI